MGQSTNGITFYGACWDDEDGAPYWPWAYNMPDGEPEARDEEEEEPEVWLAFVTAFALPEPEWPGAERTEAQAEEWYGAHRAWVAARRAHLAAAGLGGLSFGTHCSGSYPMNYVAIASTEITARRGTPERCEQPTVDPGWLDVLRRLSEVTGVAITDDKIGWWLVSNMD